MINFNLNDYQFKIVKMQVFNNKEKNENILNYYLLVDNNNFIHDYKVQFIQIYITPYTTLSHENTKIKAKDLILRKTLLKKLKLTHSFLKTKKEYFLINDKNLINNVNNYSFDYIWNEIQFQQLEYILTGSNSSGQGNGKGYLKILYKTNSYPFGLFLKTINVAKTLKKLYNNISYIEYWNKYKDFNELSLNSIDFLDWVKSNNTINNLFNNFIDTPKEWKKIRQEYNNIVSNLKTKFKNLETLVSKYRIEYVKNIKEKLKNISNNDIVNMYFNNNIKLTEFEYAHIKPVWYIKQLYTNNDDEKILEEIKNVNNFLPLPPNIHKLYDKYYFYWNIDGKLYKLNENLCTDEVEQYMQINENVYNNAKYFLNEYIQMLKNNKKI